MKSVAHDAGPIHLGLDVSKSRIAVGILRWDEQVPDVEMISSDEASVRRLIDRFPARGRLRVCYEAGPTGFGLHRLLTSMGVACDVVAPGLIPTAPADRVKTDRRDCRRLARLHRAGELVSIRIPTEAEEAVRDLCQGHHPAQSRHAISTREYQRGRAPTRTAPTRRGPPQPRPPPGRSLLARPAGLKAKPLRGGYASLDPDRPNKHAQIRADDAQKSGTPTHTTSRPVLTLDMPFHIRKGTFYNAER